jgi:hypothetical protein
MISLLFPKVSRPRILSRPGQRRYTISAKLCGFRHEVEKS